MIFEIETVLGSGRDFLKIKKSGNEERFITHSGDLNYGLVHYLNARNYSGDLKNEHLVNRKIQFANFSSL